MVPADADKPADQAPKEDRVRALLRELMREHRWDPTNLSREIGRSPTYIRDYLDRGSPRVLPEPTRDALAAVFTDYTADDFKLDNVNASLINGLPQSESGHKSTPEARGNMVQELFGMVGDNRRRLSSHDDRLTALEQRLHAIELQLASGKNNGRVNPQKRGA